MAYYVYVLESLKTGTYYVGVTHDPSQRLRQHNSGLVASTKPFRPWHLLGMERYPDLGSARTVENRLKGGKSRGSVERFLRRSRLVPTPDLAAASWGRDPDSSGGGDRDC